MNHKTILALGSALLALAAVGCNPTSENPPAGGGKEGAKGEGSGGATTAGEIKIDGSSTVYPIATALVEGFGKVSPSVRITVGESGTGAGLKKFAAKEIDIADASKTISKKQVDEAKKNGVEFIELPIAYDGLSIVVNKGNTWASKITVAQLKKIWSDGSQVKLWSDVDAAWPKEPIKLYGPTSVHGSYEYFNEVINGNSKNSRQDYSQNPEYNSLITAVGGNKNALGYVGMAYVEQNQDTVKAVPVDAGSGPVSPSAETINNGTYKPLARPLLMYIRKDAADRPEVKAYIEYALSKEGREAVSKQGYVPFSDDIYELVLARFKAGTTGTVMEDFGKKTLKELLSAK